LIDEHKQRRLLFINWNVRRIRISSSARPNGAISTRPVVVGYL
jgi:hypothetical protein